MSMCREPDLNRRTPARLDPESSAVDQAWLSLHQDGVDYGRSIKGFCTSISQARSSFSLAVAEGNRRLDQVGKVVIEQPVVRIERTA